MSDVSRMLKELESMKAELEQMQQQPAPPDPPTPPTQPQQQTPEGSALDPNAVQKSQSESELEELRKQVSDLRGQVKSLIDNGAQFSQGDKQPQQPAGAYFSQVQQQANPHANVKAWEDLDFSM